MRRLVNIAHAFNLLLAEVYSSYVCLFLLLFVTRLAEFAVTVGDIVACDGVVKNTLRRYICSADAPEDREHAPCLFIHPVRMKVHTG